MRRENDLTTLVRRIDAIREEERATLERDGWMPIRSVSASFTEEDWNALSRLVTAIGHGHRATLNRFLGDVGLAAAVVGVLADDDVFDMAAHPDPPADIAELVSRIDERQADDTWLVAIPIYGTALPDPLMELDDRTFLLRPDQAMEPEAWGLDDPERELRRRLGDAPDIRTRWLRAPSVHATPSTRTWAQCL